MSKKRNKDRNKITSFDLSETADNSRAANELNNIERLEKGGLLTYLKSRWWIVGVIALLSFGAFGAGLKYLEEDARRQIMSGNWKNDQNQSFLNSINPFLPAAPVVNSTHQLSKEYIYAGDRLLAVEDANATAVPPADLAVWRPGTGGWYVMGDSNVLRFAIGFGQSSDKPAPGDYDGDGKTDFCVVRPDQTADKLKWFILRSGDGVISEVHWGKYADRDNPRVQADYDGDDITDVAVINSTQNSGQLTWVISKSTNLSSVDIIPFGQSTDLPAPADYDGDGKADIAVWRNSTKSFYRLKPDFTVETVTFTENSIEPVSSDFDGDGKADYAIRRQSDGYWIIRYSSTGAMTNPIQWGFASDKAVQNDYDADGKVDIAVWRGSSGDWYISNSSNGQFRAEHWGQAGDYPVPVFYRR